MTWISWTLLGIALAIAAIMFFRQLDVFTYRIWDESRVATNSYEMARDFRFPETTINGHTDTWNTKPPLLPLAQSILIRLFGMDELSVRLPSAIAGFVLCGFLLWFGYRYFRSMLPGFVATMLLVSSEGAIGLHGFRFGDYEGFLVLFTTLYLIFFFLWMEMNRGPQWFILFLGLAIFTKGIAALIFGPALLVYLLVSGNGFRLRSKRLWLSVAILLGTVVLYYAIREIQHPGFFRIMLGNEVGGRFGNAVEGHYRPFRFYFENFTVRMNYFWVAGLIALFAAPWVNFGKARRFTLFLALSIIVYLGVISASKTKIDWYDLPIYPQVGLQIGFLLFGITDFVRSKSVLLCRIMVLLFAAVTVIPAYLKHDEMFLIEEHPWHREYYDPSHYLRERLEAGDTLRNVQFVDDEYAAHNWLYIRQLNQNGSDIIVTASPDTSEVGKILMTFRDRSIHRIDSQYVTEEKGLYGSLRQFRIIAKKTKPTSGPVSDQYPSEMRDTSLLRPEKQ